MDVHVRRRLANPAIAFAPVEIEARSIREQDAATVHEVMLRDIARCLTESPCQSVTEPLGFANERAGRPDRGCRGKSGQVDLVPFHGKKLLRPPQGQQQGKNDMSDDFVFCRTSVRDVLIPIPVEQSALSIEGRYNVLGRAVGEATRK